MPTTDHDRNHLYSLLALKMDFVSRDTLRLAVKAWDADPSRSIGSILLEFGELAPSRAALLDTLVDEHLQVHSSQSSPVTVSFESSSEKSSDLRSTLDQLLGNSPVPAEANVGPHAPDRTMANDPVPAVGDIGGTVAGVEPGFEVTQADPDLDDVNDTHFDVKTFADNGDDGNPTQHGGHPDSGPRPPMAQTAHLGHDLASHAMRYTILKHHAKGGLGDVYIARDEELNREVALKEIQEKHADRNDSRLRFLIEAEITGGLEHPGIVPVYGLGNYPDGRPYYAMRFIRGETLRDSLDRFHEGDEDPHRDPGERTLALRSLLGCIIDVCNAIGYAHTRGVLHRDLKPGNIMLGKFGETLVVDWGLAKTVNQLELKCEPGQAPLLPASVTGSTPTMMGSVIGTLQFMSPEQAFGKLDDLGPGCDIYSLGATLYVVLTGVTAFPDPTAGIVLHKVQKGEFKRPREVNPRVPAALDAICMKAMAFQQEDRYLTMRELAQDLEHWLADEPVSVYREPFAKRAARWARRHHQAVAGVGAVVLTVIISLVVSNVLIGRERDRTLVAKRESDAHYVLGRKTIETMLDEAAAIDLADVPLMEPVRRRMLLSALGFYNDFLKTRNEDPALLLDVVRANVRLGEIHEALGEARLSEDAYRVALRTFDALPVALRSNLDFRRVLASAEFGLGILMKKSNRFREADVMLRRTLVTREAIATESATPREKRESALALYHLGALLARQKSRTPDDEKTYRAALEQQQAVLKDLKTQDSSDVRRDIARNLNNLGILLRGSDPNAALATFRDAYDRQLALEKESPESPSQRWQVARSATNLGGLLSQIKPDDSLTAEEILRQGLTRFKRLVGDFPKIPDYRQELAAVDDNLSGLFVSAYYSADANPDPAKVKEHAASLARAQELLAEAVTIRDALVKDFPQRPDYAQSLGIALRHQAEAFKLDSERRTEPAKTELTTEAKAKIDRSILLQTRLLEQFPDARDYDVELARSENVAGFVARQANSLPEAADHFARAADLFKKSSDANPKSASLRRELGDQYRALSATLLFLNRIDDALKAIEAYVTSLGDDPAELSRAARGYATAIAKTIEDKNSSIEIRDRLIDSRSARCVELLRNAFKQGYPDFREIANPVYAPLTGRDDFTRLKREIEAKAKAPVG